MSQHHLLERLEERKNLTAGEKAMQVSAFSKGLATNKFGIFKDSGIRGMYNMSLKNLKQYKNFGTKTTAKDVTLYDFMNLEEMAANTFRTTQTAAKIRNTKNISEKGIIDTAKEVGKEVRSMMVKNSGVQPEDMPLEDLSVKKISSTVRKSKKNIDKIDQKNKS